MTAAGEAIGSVAALHETARDPQTVTPEGRPVQELIDGVRVRPAVTHLDERGSVCEMYSPEWDFTEEPLVYVYQTTIRPGHVKGWVLHLEQDDRLCFLWGDVKIVLYDAREDSPTYGWLNVHHFGESHRGLLRIPRGVYHAIQNVGRRDAAFVNMPTRPYRHENPDKYRLPARHGRDPVHLLRQAWKAAGAVAPEPVRRARLATVGLATLPRLALRTRARATFAELGEPPLVSIVIATYNWSSVLRHSIASALAQTYPRFEVLVIGDGCTDDSAEVAASFGDPRVRWHNLEQNSGSQAGPNNAGIELAAGDFIAYHGHDDIWLPSHLALVMRALLRTGADLGYGVTERVGPPGSGHRALVGVSVRGRYRAGEWIAPSAVVHRKRIVDVAGPWRHYRTIVEPPDYEFLLRAHRHGFRFVCSHALTVFKFSALERPNSYIEKPSHEQAAYRRRIEGERAFVGRELLAVAGALAASYVRRPGRDLPRSPEPPNPLPPGWKVAQFRRIRGLDP